MAQIVSSPGRDYRGPQSWSTWAIHCEFAARPATTWPNGPGTWSQPWLPSYGFASLCNMRTKLPLTTKPLPGCGGTLLPWQLSFWPLKPFPCGGLIGRTAMEVPVEPESD